MPVVIDGRKVVRKRSFIRDNRKLLLTIGVGLYCYKLGRESGIKRGIEIGYVKAAHNMIDSLDEHTLELRRARGM